RVPAGAQEQVVVVPERPRDQGGAREQELPGERREDPLPGRDADREHEHRRKPLAGAPTGVAREPTAAGALGRGRRGHASSPAASFAGPAAWPWASASRTVVTSSKYRGSSRVSIVRGCGRSISTTSVIRPGRADITTTRVERKTASAIEWVTNT